MHGLSIRRVLLPILSVALLGTAVAQQRTPVRNDNIYKAQEEGWFWYEREPEAPKEEKKEPQKKPPPTPSIIKLEAPKDQKPPEIEPLSVKWLLAPSSFDCTSASLTLIATLV